METIEFEGELFRVVRRPWYGGYRIVFDVRRQARVIVSKSRDLDEIRGFLAEKRQWILQTRAKIAAVRRAHPAPSFDNGSTVLFRGRVYPLEIAQGEGRRSHVDVLEHSIRVTVGAGAPEKEVPRALLAFYRKCGKE